MRRIFVKTQNVKTFIGLVENLINKPNNIPKMGLVYGEPGLGKSQTALWLAAKYDGIYLRCTNLMTGRWLLEELAKELEEIPRFLTADNFNLCVQNLSKKPQIIIIDEIDYLMNDTKTIETLRDIHDKTNCPIIFVGMGLAHKKLERYKHLYDRFSEIVKFETFSISDVKQIFDKTSEVPFAADMVEILHKKYNRFRQIVQVINQFEIIAKENNLMEITSEIIEVIL
jgi:DNA transposition AAA+ family ATPase